MTWTSTIVLFVVIWALTLFIVLPIGMVTQADDGEVEPGTPASAPADEVMLRKFAITTVAAIAVFAIIYGTIQFGGLTLDDIPFLDPPASYQ